MCRRYLLRALESSTAGYADILLKLDFRSVSAQLTGSHVSFHKLVPLPECDITQFIRPIKPQTYYALAESGQCFGAAYHCCPVSGVVEFDWFGCRFIGSLSISTSMNSCRIGLGRVNICVVLWLHL